MQGVERGRRENATECSSSSLFPAGFKLQHFGGKAEWLKNLLAFRRGRGGLRGWLLWHFEWGREGCLSCSCSRCRSWGGVYSRIFHWQVSENGGEREREKKRSLCWTQKENFESFLLHLKKRFLREMEVFLPFQNKIDVPIDKPLSFFSDLPFIFDGNGVKILLPKPRSWKTQCSSSFSHLWWCFEKVFLWKLQLLPNPIPF